GDGAAHGWCERWLHASRRHPVLARADRLERSIPARFRERKKTTVGLRVPRQRARTRCAPRYGQILSRGRLRAGQVDPGIPCPPTGDCETSLPATRAAFRVRHAAAIAGRSDGQKLSRTRHRSRRRLSHADRQPRGVGRRCAQVQDAAGFRDFIAARGADRSWRQAAAGAGVAQEPWRTRVRSALAGRLHRQLRHLDRRGRLVETRAGGGSLVGARHANRCAAAGVRAGHPGSAAGRGHRAGDPARRIGATGARDLVRESRIPVEGMSMLTRRQFLANSAIGAATLVIWPKLTFAATGSDTRFLFVLLRGGLDGLESVPPYGDPGYQAIRGALALSPSAQKPAHKLDNVFALHPSFGYAAQLYAQGRFMPVVAAAPPYWGRSHFQAQNCVENGTAKPDGAQTGWLNRCITCMPGVDGLACAAVMPLTMRGSAKVETWSPPLPTEVNPILLQRLQPLYAADTRLAASFARAVGQQTDSPVPETGAGMMANGKPGKKQAGGLPVMMAAAGNFMGKAD